MPQQSIQEPINDLRNAKKFFKPDWNKRIAAAKRLGELKATQAVNDLAAVIKENESAELCQAAIQALGQIGDDQAIATLIDAWEYSAPNQNDSITHVLQSFEAEQVVEQLLVAYEHSSPVVREESKKVLQQYADIKRHLIVLMGSKDTTVRNSAKNLLVQFGVPAAPDLVDALRQTDDDQIVAELINIWERVGIADRGRISQALVDLGPKRTFEPLTAALGHWSGTMCEQAGEVLRQYEGVAPHLVEMMGDEGADPKKLDQGVL